MWPPNPTSSTIALDWDSCRSISRSSSALKNTFCSFSWLMGCDISLKNVLTCVMAATSEAS